MAAICPDFKWLGFWISDPIRNPDHLQPKLFWPFKIQTRSNFRSPLYFEAKSHWIQAGIEPGAFWSRVTCSAIWATVLSFKLVWGKLRYYPPPWYVIVQQSKQNWEKLQFIRKLTGILRNLRSLFKLFPPLTCLRSRRLRPLAMPLIMRCLNSRHVTWSRVSLVSSDLAFLPGPIINSSDKVRGLWQFLASSVTCCPSAPCCSEIFKTAIWRRPCSLS